MAESFGSVVVNGWRDGFMAVYRMPILFLTAFWIFLGVRIVSRHVDAPDWVNEWFAIGFLIKGTINHTIDAVITTSVLIAVHRYVILHEVQDRPVWQLPANYLRFGMCLLGLNLLLPTGLASSMLLVPPMTMFSANILRAAIYVTVLVIFIRSILLFPAIAVGAGSAQWRNAWVDSRGHFWTSFLSFATIGVAMVVIYSAALLKFGFAGVFGEVGTIMMLCVDLLCCSLAAAIASRLFRNYAKALVA